MAEPSPAESDWEKLQRRMAELSQYGKESAPEVAPTAAPEAAPEPEAEPEAEAEPVDGVLAQTRDWLTSGYSESPAIRVSKSQFDPTKAPAELIRRLRGMRPFGSQVKTTSDIVIPYTKTKTGETAVDLPEMTRMVAAHWIEESAKMSASELKLRNPARYAELNREGRQRAASIIREAVASEAFPVIFEATSRGIVESAERMMPGRPLAAIAALATSSLVPTTTVQDTEDSMFYDLPVMSATETVGRGKTLKQLREPVFWRLARAGIWNSVMGFMLDPDLKWEWGGEDGLGGVRHVEKNRRGYDFLDDFDRIQKIIYNLTGLDPGADVGGVKAGGDPWGMSSTANFMISAFGVAAPMLIFDFDIFLGAGGLGRLARQTKTAQRVFTKMGGGGEAGAFTRISEKLAEAEQASKGMTLAEQADYFVTVLKPAILKERIGDSVIRGLEVDLAKEMLTSPNLIGSTAKRSLDNISAIAERVNKLMGELAELPKTVTQRGRELTLAESALTRARDGFIVDVLNPMKVLRAQIHRLRPVAQKRVPEETLRRELKTLARRAQKNLSASIKRLEDALKGDINPQKVTAAQRGLRTALSVWDDVAKRGQNELLNVRVKSLEDFLDKVDTQIEAIRALRKGRTAARRELKTATTRYTRDDPKKMRRLQAEFEKRRIEIGRDDAFVRVYGRQGREYRNGAGLLQAGATRRGLRTAAELPAARVIDELGLAVDAELEAVSAQLGKEFAGAKHAEKWGEFGEKLQEKIEGFSTGREVAEWLLENGHPATQAILRRILPHLDELGELQFKIVRPGDEEFPRSMLVSAGLWSPPRGKTPPTIWVRSSDFADGSSGIAESTLTHELLHAATMGRLYTGTVRANEGTAVYEAAAALFQINKRVIRYFRQKGRAGTRTEIEKAYVKAYNGHTGELVTYAFTAPAFQEILRKIPASEAGKATGIQNLWGEFVDTLRRLFNIPPGEVTALDEVLKATDQLLQAPVKGLAPRPGLEHITRASLLQTGGARGFAAGARTGDEVYRAFVDAYGKGTVETIMRAPIPEGALLRRLKESADAAPQGRAAMPEYSDLEKALRQEWQVSESMKIAGSAIQALDTHLSLVLAGASSAKGFRRWMAKIHKTYLEFLDPDIFRTRIAGTNQGLAIILRSATSRAARSKDEIGEILRSIKGTEEHVPEVLIRYVNGESLTLANGKTILNDQLNLYDLTRDLFTRDPAFKEKLLKLQRKQSLARLKAEGPESGLTKAGIRAAYRAGMSSIKDSVESGNAVEVIVESLSFAWTPSERVSTLIGNRQFKGTMRKAVIDLLSEEGLDFATFIERLKIRTARAIDANPEFRGYGKAWLERFSDPAKKAISARETARAYGIATKALAYGANMQQLARRYRQVITPGFTPEMAQAITKAMKIENPAEQWDLIKEGLYRLGLGTDAIYRKGFYSSVEGVSKATNRLSRELVQIGDTMIVPKNIMDQIESAFDILIKTPEEMTEQQARWIKPINKLTTYWRTGITTGYLIPNINYGINMMFGDWAQLFQEFGLVRGSAYSFSNVFSYIPGIGTRIQDRLSASWAKDVPLMGPMLNTMLNPHLAKIWNNSDEVIRTARGEWTTYKRLRTMMVEDNVYDTRLHHDIVRMLGRGSNNRYANFISRWQEDLTGFYSTVQTRQRVALYADQYVNLGKSREEAARAVTNALYDWNQGITRFEAENLVPFFAFYRYTRLAMQQTGRHLMTPFTQPLRSRDDALKFIAGYNRLRAMALVSEDLPNILEWEDPDTVLSEAEERDAIARTLRPFHTGTRPVTSVEAADPQKLSYWKQDGFDWTHTAYSLPALGPIDMAEQMFSMLFALGGLAAWGTEELTGVDLPVGTAAVWEGVDTAIGQLAVVHGEVLSEFGPLRMPYPAKLRRGEVLLHEMAEEARLPGIFRAIIAPSALPRKEGEPLRGSKGWMTFRRAVPTIGTTIPRYFDALYAGAPYLKDDAAKAIQHTLLHLTGVLRESPFSVEKRLEYQQRDLVERLRAAKKEETGE